MLKFMYKCRGSVSVFLILVLLPMLTVAGIFVDISRVRMGKAVVETASDLALNAALSQYDNMVKDLYFSVIGEKKNPYSYEHELAVQKTLCKIVGEN